MKCLKEMTAKNFIDRVIAVRDRDKYDRKAVTLGFRFAFRRKFPEVGKEFFKSNDNKLIDEELFILEVASSTELDFEEAVGLLARFFCGIQVFEDMSNRDKNTLQYLQFKDLTSYVSPKMFNEKIKYVKQTLENN